MRKLFGLLVLAWMPSVAFGIVDMRNANFSDTWLDLIVPNSGYDLRIQRTYNSRTLFNGMFGFGWCSDFETKLETTAEGNVKVTQCGGGQEVDYLARDFDPDKVKKTISEVVKEVKKRNPKMTPSFFTKLEKDLQTDTFLREEFVRQLNLGSKLKPGTMYIALGRENEKIKFSKGKYYRYLPDGTLEVFNTAGLLIQMKDRNGNFLNINRDPKSGLIDSVVDNNGNKLSFKLAGAAKKVQSIVGPNGIKVSYVHDGEDLVGMTNAWGSTYSYQYDDHHNLTKISFPDKTFKDIKYNKDKDWVVSFTDRSQCVEKYEYKDTEKEPLDYYKSLVVKTCGKKVTNKSSYEFWYREKPDGTGRYLHRAKSDNNGEVTDTYYHDVFGKPTSVLKNAQRTRYQYYDNGLLKVRTEPSREMFFKYETKCTKVSQVSTKYFVYESKAKAGGKSKTASAPVRKLQKEISTQFAYDSKKCNLVVASNSSGQKIKIGYDRKGRINLIEDQARKLVTIMYEERFGKPALVDRPGLGSISIEYDKNGKIQNVKSEQGITVATQVANVFNNLLEVIAPATGDLQI